MSLATEIYERLIPKTPARTDSYILGLQRTMLDATPDCIKLLTVDGHLLMMNKAGCLALGVPADSSFGMPWLPLLPEDVHPLGTEALRKAAAGQPARFPGRSISPGGIMYWDNLLTPNLDAEGRVVSILCVSRDITEKTLLERQLDEALDRERLLSQEMHHRIKNVFSLILGLIFIAEKEAAALHDPEAATKLLREKVEALSRASDVVFTQCLDKLHGETGDSLLVDLAKIVSSVLEPYGECCTITGGPCRYAVAALRLLPCSFTN